MLKHLQINLINNKTMVSKYFFQSKIPQIIRETFLAPTRD